MIWVVFTSPQAITDFSSSIKRLIFIYRQNISVLYFSPDTSCFEILKRQELFSYIFSNYGCFFILPQTTAVVIFFSRQWLCSSSPQITVVFYSTSDKVFFLYSQTIEVSYLSADNGRFYFSPDNN